MLDIYPGAFLTREALSPETTAAVAAGFQKNTQTGAVVTFSGIVRADRLEAGVVTAIEFSAHEEMAEKAIDTLIRRLAEGYTDPVKVFVRHALGTLAVGEVPIVIVVATTRRRAAFALCSEILEALKAEAPIFGKEILEGGGHVWKRNTPG